MPTVTLKGTPFAIKGSLPQPGDKAPDFEFVKSDLSTGRLSTEGAGIKVIIAIPSLETGICQIETREINQRLAKMEGVKAIVVSKDLPMAMKRFCETEGIENVVSASDFRGNFAEDYNTLLVDGPFKGLSSRAVFVVDKGNVIRYTELVPEIGQEPNYDAVEEAVRKLL
jgi:thiol peroxidase